MSKSKTKDYLTNEFQEEYWNKNKNQRGYDHPVVKFFVKQRLDYLKQYIDFAKLKSAFDVGCGDGFSTYYLSKLLPLVEGGDIAENMLVNNPIPRQKLKIIDAQDMKEIASNTYDLSITWEVLHHVDDPQKVVNEMARIAKKYVVIFEPNRTNPLQFGFGLLNKQERGTLRSTKKYLETLCNQAGLTIIDSTFCGKIPPNKTPEALFKYVKRMKFKSNVLTGISIAIIAEKPTN